MQKFSQFLNESQSRHDSIDIEDDIRHLYDKHKDHKSTIRVDKNVHTGATKHQIGSRKIYALRTKDSKHPYRADLKSLIKHHNGVSHPSGGHTITSSDGKKYHFDAQHGTAHSVYSVSKR